MSFEVVLQPKPLEMPYSMLPQMRWVLATLVLPHTVNPPSVAEALNPGSSAILTVKVPKPWEADNNTFIFNMPAKHPNVRLIDWNGLSQTFEDVFYSDGSHLRPEGQMIYTQLVMDTIKANS